MQRHRTIRTSLDAMQDEGFVRSWYAYSPGDSRGKRWIVDNYTFTTAEAEAFIRGAKAVIFDPRVVAALSPEV